MDDKTIQHKGSESECNPKKDSSSPESSQSVQQSSYWYSSRKVYSTNYNSCQHRNSAIRTASLKAVHPTAAVIPASVEFNNMGTRTSIMSSVQYSFYNPSINQQTQILFVQSQFITTVSSVTIQPLGHIQFSNWNRKKSSKSPSVDALR